MKILVPREIEIPDSMYIDGEQLEAEVYNTPYGGLTAEVYYESEDTHTYISVSFDKSEVYVRYNGQSHREHFEYIDDLVDYLMRSCDIGKSTKKSKSPAKSFNDMVKKQRNKNLIEKYSPVEEVDGYFYPIEKEIQQISMTAQYILDEIRIAEDKIPGTTLPEREQIFEYLCKTLALDVNAMNDVVNKLKDKLQNGLYYSFE